MKRFITLGTCLFFLCMPLMAQNRSLYTKIKRHIARKIAREAQQRHDAELAAWTKALGGNVELAKKFYANLGGIPNGLDVFYLPQGIDNLVGDDKNKVIYSTEPVVLVVSYLAVYRAYGIRNCVHWATIYNLNAQQLYETERNYKISFVDRATNTRYWYDTFESGIISYRGTYESPYPFIIEHY